MKVTYTQNRFEIDGVPVINPEVLPFYQKKIQDDHNGFHGKEIGILRFNPEINDLQIVAAPKLINDGDSVPLPDNIIAEKVYIEPDDSIHCNRGVDRYRLKLKEPLENDPFFYKTPLVDTGSKETQEELWNEVLNTCEEHMINDIRLLEMLVKKYSITRK